MTLSTITIYNLDDVKSCRYARGADKGHSKKEYARLILSNAVRHNLVIRYLTSVLGARCGPVDGVDLELLRRASTAPVFTSRSADWLVAPPDCQIATIARPHNMPVVTGATRDVEDIDIAVVDAWTAG